MMNRAEQLALSVVLQWKLTLALRLPLIARSFQSPLPPLLLLLSRPLLARLESVHPTAKSSLVVLSNLLSISTVQLFRWRHIRLGDVLQPLR